MPVIDDWMEHHHHVRIREDAFHFTFEAATATGWKNSKYRVLQTLCRRIKWLRGQVDAERARIRRELLDAIGAKRSEWALAKPLGEDGVKTDRDIGADAAFASVLAALDRICPEENKEG